MSPRLYCNVIYATLTARCGEKKDRDDLDRDLYAPMGGWGAAEQRLWGRVADAPDSDAPDEPG